MLTRKFIIQLAWLVDDEAFNKNSKQSLIIEMLNCCFVLTLLFHKHQRYSSKNVGLFKKNILKGIVPKTSVKF